MIFSSTLRSNPNLIHGFTSRLDSNGQMLDLGSQATEADWERVLRDLGVQDFGVAKVSQVHGSKVAWVDSPGRAGEADAIITEEAGVLLAIRIADCVPILVAGEGVVGAIHAGWRGLAAGVIPSTLKRMGAPSRLKAVVGPSICCDCYEVGEEVVAGIAEWVDPILFVDRSRTKPHVDGGAAAVAQLRDCGVLDVERISICTWCDDRFWSYRQQGFESGRQAAVIGLRC